MGGFTDSWVRRDETVPFPAAFWPVCAFSLLSFFFCFRKRVWFSSLVVLFDLFWSDFVFNSANFFCGIFNRALVALGGMCAYGRFHGLLSKGAASFFSWHSFFDPANSSCDTVFCLFFPPSDSVYRVLWVLFSSGYLFSCVGFVSLFRFYFSTQRGKYT